MVYLILFAIACLNVVAVRICLPHFYNAGYELMNQQSATDEWSTRLFKRPEDLGFKDDARYAVCYDVSDHGLGQMAFKIRELQEQAISAKDEIERQFIEQNIAEHFERLLEMNVIRLPAEQIPDKYLYCRNKTDFKG